MISTTAMRFVDTNVLLYSVSTAAAEQKKAQIAIEILDEHDLALSVQVLQSSTFRRRGNRRRTESHTSRPPHSSRRISDSRFRKRP
jgi:predicted nucleic acid-binding protein